MKEQNIFDNNNVTANSSQLAILRQNFPNCFDKNGNFIIDSFKEVIKDNSLDFSQESYALNWLGKSYAQLLRNEKPYTFIKPNHEHNDKKENINSQNLLIKGDNLEVLKHLRNAYTEKIKMIYIDPPYNTGSDGFIYQDDRKFTKEELMQLAKVSEYEAQRILDFTSKGSNSHSAWLTFIYPRLYIARELLREDGVIFISIDDNEQAQLKLLCDEIFGEENFEGHIHWRRRYNQPNDKNKMIGLVAEHILCYAKNSLQYRASGVGKVDITGRFSNPDNDPKGEWASKPWKTGSGQTGTTYTITTPTGKKYTEEWMGDHNTFSQHLANNRIYFPNQGDGLPRKKYYKFERLEEGQCANNWWTHEQFGHNQEASEELESLFHVKNIFSNPKPSKLISNLINLAHVNGNNIVLDFFAGSGTTAHAVMNLNAEDNGNRQFILVQLPEQLDSKKTEDKPAYNFCKTQLLDSNIFSITKSRIIKVAEKIQIDTPDYQGDLGFKIFETIPLPNHYDNEIVELSIDSQIEMFEGAKDNSQLLEAILTTWTLYDRIPLTDSLESLLIGKYEARYSKQHNTLYLMKPNFTTENIKTLIEKIEVDDGFIPKKVVIYGFNFHSKIQRELDEALRSYQNKKSLNIDLIVRYY